jgi:hypothetical protein
MGAPCTCNQMYSSMHTIHKGGTMSVILLPWALSPEHFLDWCSNVDSLKVLTHDVLHNIRVLCFYITLSREDGRVRYINVMTTSLWSLLHPTRWTCYGRGHVFLVFVFSVGNSLNVYCLELQYCWYTGMLQDVHHICSFSISDFVKITFSLNIIRKDSDIHLNVLRFHTKMTKGSWFNVQEPCQASTRCDKWPAFCESVVRLQTGSQTYWASYPIIAGTMQLKLETTSHFHLMPRYKMHGAVPSQPHISS